MPPRKSASRAAASAVSAPLSVSAPGKARSRASSGRPAAIAVRSAPARSAACSNARPDPSSVWTVRVSSWVALPGRASTWARRALLPGAEALEDGVEGADAELGERHRHALAGGAELDHAHDLLRVAEDVSDPGGQGGLELGARRAPPAGRRGAVRAERKEEPMRHARPGHGRLEATQPGRRHGAGGHAVERRRRQLGVALEDVVDGVGQ